MGSLVNTISQSGIGHVNISTNDGYNWLFCANILIYVTLAHAHKNLIWGFEKKGFLRSIRFMGFSLMQFMDEGESYLNQIWRDMQLEMSLNDHIVFGVLHVK